MIETRDSLKEKAELIIWECRERSKFNNNENCLNVFVNCESAAKEIFEQCLVP